VSGARGGDRPLAVVTGATSGIGAAFARALAARGFDLLLTGRRREVIEQVAAEIRAASGAAVEVMIADFADPAQLAAVEARLRAAPRLALLVNNAGYGNRRLFLEDTPDNQVAMLRVHAEAAVRLCHATARRLAEARGAVINVASLAAFLSAPTGHLYCATKAFLVSFSESLAMSLRPSGVRVQALCPGFTRTEFHARLGLPVARLRNRGPIRWATADRVVALSLAALARDRVVYVPGLWNRVFLAVARLTPRRLYYALASKVQP
jgi:uncharacterized protein